MHDHSLKKVVQKVETFSRLAKHKQVSHISFYCLLHPEDDVIFLFPIFIMGEL